MSISKISNSSEGNERGRNYPKAFERSLKNNWSQVCDLMQWKEGDFDHFAEGNDLFTVVTDIQKEIIKNGGGLNKYGIDGKFGWETEQALKTAIAKQESAEKREEMISGADDLREEVEGGIQMVAEKLEFNDQEISNYALVKRRIKNVKDILVAKNPKMKPVVEAYDRLGAYLFDSASDIRSVTPENAHLWIMEVVDGMFSVTQEVKHDAEVAPILAEMSLADRSIIEVLPVIYCLEINALMFDGASPERVQALHRGIDKGRKEYRSQYIQGLVQHGVLSEDNLEYFEASFVAHNNFGSRLAKSISPV